MGSEIQTTEVTGEFPLTDTEEINAPAPAMTLETRYASTDDQRETLRKATRIMPGMPEGKVDEAKYAQEAADEQIVGWDHCYVWTALELGVAEIHHDKLNPKPDANGIIAYSQHNARIFMRHAQYSLFGWHINENNKRLQSFIAEQKKELCSPQKDRSRPRKQRPVPSQKL